MEHLSGEQKLPHDAKRHLTPSEWLVRFGRDEAGTVVYFALCMFLCMLLVGGLGVDIMRYERERAKLQHTLDRAVLAAADLDQTLNPSEVVTDYFDKAGIGEYLTSVTVDEGVGYRSVSATAESKLNTYFLKMLNIDTLTAPAKGKAEERIDGIEISMVLDVSGSMDSNSRLRRLKPAARDFVDTVLASAETDNISISIVPYATQVGAGEALLSKYNVSEEHSYSHCVNFGDDEFSKSNLSQNERLERTAHFDPFYYAEGELRLPVCPTKENQQILPFSNDRTTLHNYINGLEAGGNTSIDLGMKWGTVLLDPSTQPVMNQLINEGEVTPVFAGRPHAYNNNSTLKVIVLMTDGENTNQYMLNPSLRDGLSDVWYNAAAGRYSVQRSQSDGTQYWWPHEESWNTHPFGNGSKSECNWQRNEWGSWYWGCSDVAEPGEAVRLTYPQLFARTSLKWNAEYNYSFQGNRWTEWYYNAYTYKNGTAKDQRTKNICEAAKNQGIVIFTVGFEAPRSGQRLLKRCASSESHHFDVDGLEIEDAFASIAASIRKLRLTQ